MSKISLTTFADIVSLSGIPKSTKTRSALEQMREEYKPSTDYYRQVRESIINLHERNHPKEHLREILSDLVHESRRKHYVEIIMGI